MVMDKRTRAGKLYALGYNTFCSSNMSSPTHEMCDLMRAFAVMLDEATKKKKTTPTEHSTLLYNENDVLRILREQHNLDLAVTRRGILNRVLRTLELTSADLELFSNWFTGFQRWANSREKPVEITYQMLCRKYPEWLARARQTENTTPDVEEQSFWR